MRIKTAWVQPPKPSNGQDHLGIQQPPTRIFSSLLPGLTVATDRVAYLSFYPWIVTHYRSTGLDFAEALRRAECLLTLVAERHAAESEPFGHVLGLVGRNVLSKAVPTTFTGKVSLADVAAPRSKETPSTYFKNPLGGLGQYYLGALRELDILGYDDEGNIVATEATGASLAEAFDQRVDRQRFFSVIKRGTVSGKELDDLASFCPCHLGTAAAASERERLIDILFARNAAEPSDADQKRRSTLLLLLDLAARRESLEPKIEVSLDLAFRAASVNESLDDGTPWHPPAAHERVWRAWATYERNEELSVAVLGIFWLALELADDTFNADAFSSPALRALVVARARAALGATANLTVAKAIAQRAKRLPASAHWRSDDHEFERAGAVIQASSSPSTVDEALRASVDVLLSLAARGLSDMPYAGLGFPPDLVREYPLNLANFATRMKNGWSTMTVADWVGDLATTWGLDAHLRVAVRKLFADGRDTFLVHRTDDGLKRSNADGDKPPRPGFTASRLTQAIHYLIDLGLLATHPPADRPADLAPSFVVGPTPAGRDLLGAIDG